MTAGLHVHRSPSARVLVEELATLLSAPPADPFERDVVAVPARGVERWISQELASRLGADPLLRDGVCAHVDFPRPDELLLGAVAAASPDHAAAVDAWQPGRAVWSMLAVLDEVLLETSADGTDWCAALRRHLRPTEGPASDRSYGVARRLTDTFARYAAARPGLVTGWASGDDSAPPDLSWQPELWRRLRARLGHPSPAELLDDACSALSRSEDAVDLPARLSFFGVSRLDAANLQVLAALARTRAVHLWVHCASPALWTSIASARPGAGQRVDLTVRPRNPLLASLSRDVRELQAGLQGFDVVEHEYPDPRPGSPRTLLQRLQRSLADDEEPGRRHRLAPGDRSVQVHACHGPARQVEVLREVVTGLLADDDTLEPRDVLVMCPDVEAYAPLIEATFGLDGHPGSRLRVATADRSPRQVNPLLGVAADLLDLAAGRVTASQVLDLLGTGPVKLRFRFDDDDVEKLADWTVAAGIRWGLDAEHRQQFGLVDIADGTWRSGLDRLLAGAVQDPRDGLLGDLLPVDGVDSAAIELAGRFAEFVDRLTAAVRAMRDRRTPVAWVDLLERSLAELTDVPDDEPWQAAGLRRELTEVRQSALDSAAEIGLGEFTALVAGRLEPRPTSAGFREGGVTVCTLTPMRSVPHRVVCLLGMDDGAFPRRTSVDGDDLLLRQPRVGERDPRSEDRQLLLDALCAAEEHLVVTYSGSDVRTGAPLQPAVPIGELLGALDALAVTDGGVPAGEAVVIRHPLQPFDPRNFTPGALGAGDRSFSFDESALAGAAAASGKRVPAPPLVAAALPARPEEDLELDRLVAFWQHPAKEFLRQRLEVTLPARTDSPDDALPVSLDGLGKWGVGDRVLHDRLRGLTTQQAHEYERARGGLPPGELGTVPLTEVGGTVDRILAASAPFHTGTAATVEVDVRLPDGRRLTGAVRGVHGDTVVAVQYSSVAAKHRLRAWIELLALAATHPDRTWTTAVVGRASKGRVVAVTCAPVDGDEALAALDHLVRLRDLGLRLPLPLPVATTEAYVAVLNQANRNTPAHAAKAAAGAWQTGCAFPGECDDDAHVLAWGPEAGLDRLTGWTAPAGTLPGPPQTATGDFERLARAVWQPLVAKETPTYS